MNELFITLSPEVESFFQSYNLETNGIDTQYYGVFAFERNEGYKPHTYKLIDYPYTQVISVSVGSRKLRAGDQIRLGEGWGKVTRDEIDDDREIYFKWNGNGQDSMVYKENILGIYKKVIIIE